METKHNYKKLVSQTVTTLKELLISKNYTVEDMEDLKDYPDYDMLKDDLTDSLNNVLDYNSVITDIQDLKVYYSLSNCQGDGVMFQGSLYYKGEYIKISHSGHYYHANSKSLDFETDKGQELETEFNDLYISICEDLEKIGYDFIDYEDNYYQFRENLQEVFNEYNINLETFEFDCYNIEEYKQSSLKYNLFEVFKGVYISNTDITISKYTQTTIKEFEEVE
jgi:hypothetical protein